MKIKIISVIISFFVISSTLITVIALNIDPLKLKKNTFVYEYGTIISTDVAQYIVANESVMAEAELNLDSVVYEIGEYDAYVEYLNKRYGFKIVIEDTSKPSITLEKNSFTITPGTTVTAKELVSEITDNSPVTVFFEEDDGTLVEEKNFKNEGSYILNIIAVDDLGNESAKYRVKISVSNKGAFPNISGIDGIKLNIDSDFAPLEGVTATDGEGNDITDEIQILKNNVNTSEVGIYEVIYSVTNELGNTYQRSRRVEIIDGELVE